MERVWLVCLLVVEGSVKWLEDSSKIVKASMTTLNSKLHWKLDHSPSLLFLFNTNDYIIMIVNTSYLIINSNN